MTAASAVMSPPAIGGPARGSSPVPSALNEAAAAGEPAGSRRNHAGWCPASGR